MSPCLPGSRSLAPDRPGPTGDRYADAGRWLRGKGLGRFADRAPSDGPRPSGGVVVGRDGPVSMSCGEPTTGRRRGPLPEHSSKRRRSVTPVGVQPSHATRCAVRPRIFPWRSIKLRVRRSKVLVRGMRVPAQAGERLTVPSPRPFSGIGVSRRAPASSAISRRPTVSRPAWPWSPTGAAEPSCGATQDPSGSASAHSAHPVVPPRCRTRPTVSRPTSQPG